MITRHAKEVHFSSIVIDTHSDSLGWVVDQEECLEKDIEDRQVTFPKMKNGGVTAQFFAAWCNPARYSQEVAVHRTLSYIDALRQSCDRNYHKVEIARTAADIRRIKTDDKLAAIVCVEGGHSIDDDLGVLRTYYELGARYMTLTHNNTNNWADGIFDEPKHNGLTDFGRDVVLEMNRLGMIVDISHASVKTFWDTVETTRKPIIASHSNALSLCKHPRNMSDDQLRAVSEGKGVICVTFVPQFVSEKLRVHLEKLESNTVKTIDTQNPVPYEGEMHALHLPSYLDVVDHIDHIVKVAGIDYVGIGSDFGVISITPSGLQDCSKLPMLTQELLNRGYSDSEIRKILGENVLRVMEDVIGH